MTTTTTTEPVFQKPPSIYDRPIQEHGGGKYLVKIRPADGIGEPIRVDVYCMIEALGITCPALQHAFKKIAFCGRRGKGNKIDDIHGVFDAMWRALELEKQRQAEQEIASCETPLGKWEIKVQMEAAPQKWKKVPGESKWFAHSGEEEQPAGAPLVNLDLEEPQPKVKKSKEGSPKDKIPRLTEEDVRVARTDFEEGGESCAKIARDFGVSYSRMHDILHYRTWRHVK